MHNFDGECNCSQSRCWTFEQPETARIIWEPEPAAECPLESHVRAAVLSRAQGPCAWRLYIKLCAR